MQVAYIIHINPQTKGQKRGCNVNGHRRTGHKNPPEKIHVKG